MKRIFLTATILGLSTTSYAVDFVTAKETLTTEKYSSEIEYPVLNVGAADAYSKINKQVRDQAADGCSVEDSIDSLNGYDHQATVKVLSLNLDYVSYEKTASSYCGGAHPNHYVVVSTFDVKTGEALDMNKEVPRQSWDDETVDWEDRANLEKELAALIAYNLDVTADETGCFEGTQAEIIQQIAGHSPMIAGLAADKKVVLRTSPPHALTVCMLSLEVPYELVKTYIKADSKVHTWLK